MEVTTGVVIDGRVVVEGERLPEGRRVAVALLDGDTSVYRPTPDEADELRTSAEEGRKGNRVVGLEHLKQLRREISG